ncbi:hypothetical protein GW915_09065 [bacterium]|nr:hypothetical protein [bacterium]
MRNFKANIKGMSLQSIMVALVLFAGASMLFLQMIKTFNNASEGGRVRTELDSTHSLAFQFLRRGLTEKIDWDQHISTPELDCLRGTGSGCLALAAAPKPFIGAAQSSNPLLRQFEDKQAAAARAGTPTANTATCTGTSCGINHNLSYQLLDCVDTKCEAIELIVNSSYSSVGSLRLPSADRKTPIKVAAATVLGAQPTMSKECNGRVDSINLSAQNLDCAPPTDKSVCPAGSTNNPLAFGDKLAQDGSDCRSLATITCAQQQALGLMDANNPQCVDSPDFQMYSASNFEIINPPESVTINGTNYVAEKCESCPDTGQQTCEKLEVRKCHSSDGTQVDVNLCLEQGKDFKEVFRYEQKFTKACTPPVYRGSAQCPNRIPTGRNRNGGALSGYQCPANPCADCTPQWVNGSCGHGVWGRGSTGTLCWFTGEFKDKLSYIEIYENRCLRTSGRFNSNCVQWSGHRWWRYTNYTRRYWNHPGAGGQLYTGYLMYGRQNGRFNGFNGAPVTPYDNPQVRAKPQ